MSVPNGYNVRVYGILFNPKGELMLSHEYRFGKEMLKFPGGGNQFGEGLSDTLIREFQEEFAIKVEVEDLFYVNDFLQLSAFRSTDQLLSVYYKVTATDLNCLPESREFQQKEGEYVRWVALENIDPEDMTFPIDKKVIEKLKA